MYKSYSFHMYTYIDVCMFGLSCISKFTDISYCFTVHQYITSNVGGKYIYVYVHLFSYLAVCLL